VEAGGVQEAAGKFSNGGIVFDHQDCVRLRNPGKRNQVRGSGSTRVLHLRKINLKASSLPRS
jgi:hypothetical protein